KNDGKVGMGTTDPNAFLHINENAGNSLSYALELQNQDGSDSGGSATGVLFSVESPNDYGKGAIVYERNASFARGDFHFLQNTFTNTDNPSLTNAVMTIKNSGDVGIGITDPMANLHVAGDVRADGGFFSSDTTIDIPDYVFENYYTGYSSLNPTYTIKDLKEVEKFVKEKHHLPGIKSAKEIKKQGFWNLTEASSKNLEKIEELFLHTIAQEKEIQQLKAENELLSSALKNLQNDLDEIKAMLKKQ
ncbi:MAG: hypothetical protein AAGB24_16560, partial [Bacteroidota bacterium]